MMNYLVNFLQERQCPPMLTMGSILAKNLKKIYFILILSFKDQ